MVTWFEGPATEQADALGVPVLVYHGLRHDYPWASDRLHTFILEGVRDLVTALHEPQGGEEEVRCRHTSSRGPMTEDGGRPTRPDAPGA